MLQYVRHAIAADHLLHLPARCKLCSKVLSVVRIRQLSTYAMTKASMRAVT